MAPRPFPDVLSRPFWEGARDGRLVIQRCTRSGRLLHPPQALCWCCGRSELDFVEVAGAGRIATFVVTPASARTADAAPTVHAWIELDAQDGLIVPGPVVGPDLDVAIGRRAEISFAPATDGEALPQVRLTT